MLKLVTTLFLIVASFATAAEELTRQSTVEIVYPARGIVVIDGTEYRLASRDADNGRSSISDLQPGSRIIWSESKTSEQRSPVINAWLPLQQR